jgi:hypothetical protein
MLHHVQRWPPNQAVVKAWGFSKNYFATLHPTMHDIAALMPKWLDEVVLLPLGELNPPHTPDPSKSPLCDPTPLPIRRIPLPRPITPLPELDLRARNGDGACFEGHLKQSDTLSVNWKHRRATGGGRGGKIITELHSWRLWTPRSSSSLYVRWWASMTPEELVKHLKALPGRPSMSADTTEAIKEVFAWKGQTESLVPAGCLVCIPSSCAWMAAVVLESHLVIDAPIYFERSEVVPIDAPIAAPPPAPGMWAPKARSHASTADGVAAAPPRPPRPPPQCG